MLQKIVNVFHFPFFFFFFFFSFQSKRNLESNLLFLEVQYQATLMLQKIVNMFHFPSFKVNVILNPIFCFSKYNTKVVNASKDSKHVSFSFFQSKRNLESNLLFLKVQYQGR